MLRWFMGLFAAVWMLSGAAMAAPLSTNRPVVTVFPFGVKAAVSRVITL